MASKKSTSLGSLACFRRFDASSYSFFKTPSRQCCPVLLSTRIVSAWPSPAVSTVESTPRHRYASCTCRLIPTAARVALSPVLAPPTQDTSTPRPTCTPPTPARPPHPPATAPPSP